jgi:hypothetical protein
MPKARADVKMRDKRLDSDMTLSLVGVGHLRSLDGYFWRRSLLRLQRGWRTGAEASPYRTHLRTLARERETVNR